MRSLISFAAALVLVLPITASGQQYACGESCQVTPGASRDVTASKTKRVLKKLRETVALKPIGKRRDVNPNIGLVDYQIDVEPEPSAPADRPTRQRKMHREGVAAIPATLPEEDAVKERVNQIRFINKPSAKLQRENSRSQRQPALLDVGLDEDIMDPADDYQPKWEVLPTVSSITELLDRPSRSEDLDERNMHGRDHRKLSAEEVAAYVRQRRRRSGFQWPWSR